MPWDVQAEGWDAREWTIKGRELPRKRGGTISKYQENDEENYELPCVELELNLYTRDWSSDLPEEDIILNYYSNCACPLLWIFRP